MSIAAYDMIIIGTGQAGKPLALALGAAGWRVAVIERKYVGGTCINVGCTPTKTMVASAKVAYLVRRSEEFGLRVGAIEIDLPAVRRRKQAVVERFRSAVRKSLEQQANVELVFGEAAFTDAHTVRVALDSGRELTLTAPRIVINTGGRPAVPRIPGLDHVPYLDSTSIMELDAVPQHLVVLGGGYIGLEFAQMFRRFGARVTVVTRDERLIAREDPDVSVAVEELLSQDGIEFHKEAAVERIDGNSGVRLSLTLPTGGREVSGSHVLVAVGRTPNTERLNLAAAGVTTDRAGYIQVNERLETAVQGIYATGDVKGGPAFTHISYDDYRILRANLLDGEALTTNGRLVPNTMYIDPQLATVGINESEAKRRGLDYQVARLDMNAVARAIEVSETRGFMKAIVERSSKRILGCTVLGMEGGEIMSMLQIAMMSRLPCTALRDAVFAHPTLAESLNNLFADT
jgi:pyruvate/2-oxoglutarate dehydrogenase complex dihydrolipoamide dehydrogenase (E3) component